MSTNEDKRSCNGDETTGGSYFVNNYPPYSFWGPESVGEVHGALEGPPLPDTPLGIYLHIPFCRKRCHFCYFKVYTDKKAPEIENYIDAAIAELRLYSQKPFITGRKPSFIYFGGGTPSYLSTRQLSRLVVAMKKMLPWDAAEEITFECEPGTLTESKLRMIRDIGVTRLSLGIENFDDRILEINGRAHRSKEIGRAYDFARSIGFPQINIDLIAGMMGESTENWKDCVRKTIEMSPDSITAYQMEIPFNTTIFANMKVMGDTAAPVANWGTKREWIRYAFAEFEKAGYTITSAYTAVKDPARTKFLYRDMLWQGADMIGVGVASISHAAGIHFQNENSFGDYIERIESGSLPIHRAQVPSDDERMIRELILQLKLGYVSRSYVRDKFGVDLEERFSETLGALRERGLLAPDEEYVRLNREGLLRVDHLLHDFFLPEHRTEEYATAPTGD